MEHSKLMISLGRTPRYRYLSLILLALACLVVTIYIFVSMRSTETKRLELEFKQAAQSHLTIIEKETQRHIAKLTSLSQLYAASEIVTPEEFKTYVESFTQGLTNMQALEWIPRIPEKERSAFEAARHKEGFSGFHITEINSEGELIPAGMREEYYPVYYVEPYAGNEMILGFDAASDDDRRNALHQARDSGHLAAAFKIRLVRGVSGVVLYYPVYRQGTAVDTLAERRQHLEGFFAEVAIFGSIARQLSELLRPLDVDIYLFTRSGRQTHWVVTHIPSATRREPAETASTPDVLRIDLHQEKSLKFGQVETTWIAKPSPNFFAVRRAIHPWLVLGAGLALFLVILSYTAIQINRLTLLRQLAAEQAIVNEKLAEANRELETFVYTVSHDLRSPLAPILGYAEHLQSTYKGRRLDDQAIDCLETIQIQGYRMMTLMEDLLTLATVGHLERPEDTVDVQEVVQQVRNNLDSSIASADIEVRTGELPEINVPRVLLTQVFDNLIGNAVRYAGDKGGPIVVGGNKSDGRVQLFVRDHGPGIPEEERERIFEVFYRGSTGKSVSGTGVGLATVKKIAKLYGGSAWVEETPGGGATFCVEMEG